MSFKNLLERYATIGGKKRDRKINIKNEDAAIEITDSDHHTESVSSFYIGCLLLQFSGNTLVITAADISESFFDFINGSSRSKLSSSQPLLQIHNIEESDIDYKTGLLLIKFRRINELKLCCTKFIQDGFFRVNKGGDGVKVSLSKVLLISEAVISSPVGIHIPKNTAAVNANIFDQNQVSRNSYSIIESSTEVKPTNEVFVIYHSNMSPSMAFNKDYSSISVVISQYTESLTWLPNHWFKFTYLYCKNEIVVDGKQSKRRDNDKYLHFEWLTNVGRESHTYLHHIITHYDNLTDIVYFTQANPFDHSPHFISLVDANVGVIQPYLMLGDKIHTITNRNVTRYEQNFPGIQDGFNRTIGHLFGDPILSALSLSNNNTTSSGNVNSSSDADFQQHKRSKNHESNRVSSTSTSTTSFNTRSIQFSPGATMSVHRDCIRSRSKEYYENALKLLDYSVNPIEGHAFERLWSLIFIGNNNTSSGDINSTSDKNKI